MSDVKQPHESSAAIVGDAAAPPAAPPAASPAAIAVAPNGGRLTKADHPALPMTPAEIGRTAARCLEAGAAMIHLHVRDAAGRHLLDADAYRAALAAVRANVGDRLLVQVTSESLGRYAPAEQMAVVEAVRPEAVSLALRELAPEAGAEPAFLAFLGRLAAGRILPQIILYAPEEVARLAALVDRAGILAAVPVLYVLGRYTAGQVSAPSDLVGFVARAATSPPPGEGHRERPWMACAFGRRETACLAAAALLGGDVRVGFENNRANLDGATAAGNDERVAEVRAALSACGIGVADADALRARWHAALGWDGVPASR
jgi:3-keto-5-aminohexanoate cleavage enzyme